MYSRFASRLPIAFLLAIALFPSVGFSQEKAEGTVVSTKLTACQFKPGGCEGYLTLEGKGAAKTELTIKVVFGTVIKKGNEYAYLPALRGKLVTVSYVTDKGEKLAKLIEVVEAKR